jgi:RimJ/RimL family protein N-acetyltransferase
MILETARLTLREIVPADAPAYYRFFADPETMRFYPSTRSFEETEEFVQRQLRRYEADGFGPWAMELKNDANLIGYCGLIHQIVDDKHEVEIGYLVDRNYWRQGFASEAAIACREYAWNVLRLTRVISMIDPLNVASIGVALKVGMTLEKQTFWQGKLMSVYTLSRTR